jgi:hypothetical protein
MSDKSDKCKFMFNVEDKKVEEVVKKNSDGWDSNDSDDSDDWDSDESDDIYDFDIDEFKNEEKEGQEGNPKLTRPFSELYMDISSMKNSSVSPYSFFLADKKKQELWKKESIRFYKDLVKIQNNRMNIPDDVEIILHIGGYTLETIEKGTFKSMHTFGEKVFIMLILPTDEKCSELAEKIKKIYVNVRGLKIYRCPFPTVNQFGQKDISNTYPKISTETCAQTNYVKQRRLNSSELHISKMIPTLDDLRFVADVENVILDIIKPTKKYMRNNKPGVIVKFLIYNDAIVSEHKNYDKIDELFAVICSLVNRIKTEQMIKNPYFSIIEPHYNAYSLITLFQLKQKETKFNLYYQKIKENSSGTISKKYITNKNKLYIRRRITEVENVFLCN